MNRVAAFEKVSFDNFAEAYVKAFGDISREDLEKIYDGIRIPERATAFSCGYDFRTTADIELNSGKEIMIPTGIRVKIDAGWGLFLFPRSGLGFKYRLQLNNTVGIIDGDYYNSDNEGHIFIKVINDSREGRTLSLKTGDAFAQGVFIPYGITYDDESCNKRNGGFGSTS